MSKMPKFEPLKVLLFLVFSLVAVGIVSWLITSIFPDIKMLQVGIPFLFIMVVLGAILPFIFVINDGKFDKNDLLGLLLYIMFVLAAIIFLPKVLPDFFGQVPELLDSIKIFQSVLGLP